MVGSKDPIKQHSFEIAWAVFRCASLVGHERLKSELENAAVSLVANSSGGAAHLDRLEHLWQLVRLAEVVGEIKAINAGVLHREIGILNTAIRQSEEKGKEMSKAINLERIFLKKGNLLNNKAVSKAIYNKANDELGNDMDNPENKGNIIDEGNESGVRQSLIFEKVRQLSGDDGCRFGDLYLAFPNISERTLRYDLQKLCDEGKLERVGNKGPASYYRDPSVRHEISETDMPVPRSI